MIWVAKIPLGSAQEFIFLDEVHTYPKWNREIKVLHDQQLPLHFVVSGSASSIVLRDTAVALAGRSIEQPILPLMFSEILEGKLEGPVWEALRPVQTALSQFLTATFRRNALLAS